MHDRSTWIRNEDPIDAEDSDLIEWDTNYSAEDWVGVVRIIVVRKRGAGLVGDLRISWDGASNFHRGFHPKFTNRTKNGCFKATFAFETLFSLVAFFSWRNFAKRKNYFWRLLLSVNINEEQFSCGLEFIYFDKCPSKSARFLPFCWFLSKIWMTKSGFLLFLCYVPRGRIFI